jgi:predicted metal-dependent hydrolase
MVEVDLDGRAVPVKLRRDVRTRLFSLRVRPGPAVTLTIPAGQSTRSAERFLSSKVGWLAARLAELPAARPIRHGSLVPVRGVQHVVRLEASRRRTPRAEAGEPPAIIVGGDAEHLRRRIIEWLKREALRDLETAVMRYAAAAEVRPAAIRLKDTRSRWGSCSSRRTLSFSWRLVLAPPLVLDYLAAHEVAHLRELNHSPAYWRLLRRICPHVDEAEAWLKAHGRSLHAVGEEG